MMYEIKTVVEYQTEKGTTKKLRESFLVEYADSITEACHKFGASKWADTCKVVGVVESRIIEEANPQNYHPLIEGWTVYLEKVYVDENSAKVKRMRYAVLLWNDGMPSVNDGELKAYLAQINDGSEFKVVKISKSPVIAMV